MRKLVSILSIGMLQISVADTLPLTTGSSYYLTIIGESPGSIGLPNHSTPAKIIRQFDYPWVEVEWESGRIRVVDGKPTKTDAKLVRKFLNLDHVVAITLAGS